MEQLTEGVMSTTTVPYGMAVGPAERAAQARRQLAEQRMYRARKLLLDRLALKELHDGLRMAAEILEDPPDVLISLRVHSLLVKVNGWGGALAARACRSASVSPEARLGAMDEFDRLALASVLRSWKRTIG